MMIDLTLRLPIPSISHQPLTAAADMALSAFHRRTVPASLDGLGWGGATIPVGC